MAEKQRQQYIDSIMSAKHEDYNPRYRAFLETLTLTELQDLSEEVVLEGEL